jgi:hypothetical protein
MDKVVVKFQGQVEGDRGMILNDLNNQEVKEKFNVSMPSNDLTLFSGHIAEPAPHSQILPRAYGYSRYRNESWLISSHWVIGILTPRATISTCPHSDKMPLPSYDTDADIEDTIVSEIL